MECKGRSSVCDACDGSGVFEVICCPLEWIEERIWQMIELAELYEKGLPPVAGGALDQTAYFVRFAKQVMDESAQYKLE